MKCTNCGNTDQVYFGMRHGELYCRKCVSFNGDKVKPKEISSNIKLKLHYVLSSTQERIADQVLESIKDNKNVLINAVTGAGKTELVYKTMEYMLIHKKTVGFATPRKDVVIDLTPRIISAFPRAITTSVYGGHTRHLLGDIIVLTTHQLYRYEKYFDLLIVDEIDAFPYAGEEMLHTFCRKSVKGNIILLSATPSKEDIEEIVNGGGVVLNLDSRYHGSPLPVPRFIKSLPIAYIACIKEIKRIVKEGKQLFVFVPTIDIGKKLYKICQLVIRSIYLVYSSEEHRAEKIEAFKKGKIQILITTSILERGVTVKDLQVIVYKANHSLYSSAALIQIAGRVGRKIGATTGEVIFIGDYYNENIRKAIQTIEETNRRALLSRF